MRTYIKFHISLFPGSYWMAIKCLATRHWKNSLNGFEFRNKGRVATTTKDRRTGCIKHVGPFRYLSENSTISLAELNSQPNKFRAGNNCSIARIVFVERTKVFLSPVTAAIVYVCVFSIPSSDS